MNNIISAKSVFTFIYNELISLYSENEAKSIAFITLDSFGISKSDIVVNKPLNKAFEDLKKEIQPVINRLKQCEPLQYVLGWTEFYGYKFYVDSNVLIPRPETEELVDLIIQENTNQPSLTILDICTGSGCIAIALEKEIANSLCYAIDISSPALKIAAKNAEVNQAQITFGESNILEEELIWPEITFDIVVSNPPYVTMSEKKLMHKNVLNFEPALALFVEDSNPLIFYERISDLAIKSLNDAGKLYFEINETFGEEVKNIMEKRQFKNIQIIKDINGKNRIVRGNK